MMINGWGDEMIQLYRAAWLIALVTWPLVWFASLSTYKQALGPEVSAVWTRRWRVWLATVSFGVGWCLMAFRFDSVVPGGMSLEQVMRSNGLVERALEHAMDTALIVGQLWCVGLLPVLAGALGVKLYEKWVNGRTSEAERRPGAEGVRAWIGGWNLILVLGILVCNTMGYGYLSIVAALFVAALVLAYPLSVAATSRPGAAGMPAMAGGGADLTPERERVLRMLEEGKVTAEEAAELLSALGHTIPAEPSVEPWTPGRKLVMAGAAVVLVGFFLPWFSFNPGAEVRRMMGQAATSMGMDARAIPGTDMVETGGATVHVAGGDIGHGLGWIMLALALGAAVTPFVATGLPREQRRVVMLVALAAGGIVGLYLLTGNFSRVDLGLPIVLVGYGVEAFGVVRDQVAWRGAPAYRATAQVV
jgi:hypothetical protein